jgi:acyl transferase domain-containing protein/acyl carrier protein
MSDVEHFESEIAVIGMSGCFPGAATLEQYWKNLCDGLDTITRTIVTDNGRSRTDALGMINDIDLFDAPFFNFNPREAEITDPQQRLFLERAWEALENAGYGAEDYRGCVGVYAGVSASRYGYRLYANEPLLKYVGEVHALLGNEKDFLTTRVSYKLNLRGPSIVVQTACSTALVATHLACQSLLNGECDLALAGGVTIMRAKRENPDDKDAHAASKKQTSQQAEVEHGGVISSDGYCRAFDANAGGTIGGEGVGIVVLKRLSEARRDGDYIHAIIKGSAINNDGARKFGFTAPSVEGQATVISEVLTLTGIEPDSVTYIEAHGTGTPLGDPVEIAALTQSFREHTDKKGYCAIGSVKTNIGHTDAAAGAAGLIKTVLSLEHAKLPPSLYYEEPNPEIDFENSPFFVNTQLREWARNGKPRRAGVSSFGIGGTNVHLIVEEAGPREVSGKSREFSLLLLSAKTPTALQTAGQNLADHLQKNPGLNLADVAFTLQAGRKAFNCRRAIVCHNVEEALEQLSAPSPQNPINPFPEERALPVIMLFPGDGVHVNLGRAVYEEEKIFRKYVDECCEALKTKSGIDLARALYPVDSDSLAANVQFVDPAVSKTALFVVEYALARLLLKWGIQPEILLGEGVGELVAACVAEVLPPEEALELIVVHEKAQAEGEESLFKYKQLVKRIEFKPPKYQWLSSVTGDWVTEADATGAGDSIDQWHCRSKMTQVLSQLLKEKEGIFLEVGAANTIGIQPVLETQLVKSLLAPQNAKDNDNRALIESVAQLWIVGNVINWNEFYAGERRFRLPLPTYPFERQSYWLEFGTSQTLAPASEVTVASAQSVEPSPEPLRNEVADWCYIPTWKRSFLPESDPASTKHCYLVFMEPDGLGEQLASGLQLAGNDVIRVFRGDAFSRVDECTYRINPQEKSHYDLLLRQIAIPGRASLAVLHLWSLAERKSRTFEDLQYSGFYSILFMVKAFSEIRPNVPVDISLISQELQDITGEEELCPEKSTVLGISSVIAQEHPNIKFRTIDLGPLVAGGPEERKLAQRSLREIQSAATEASVAYRGVHRLTKSFEKVPMSPRWTKSFPIRQGGVYVHTSALAEGDLELVQYLAKSGKPKLVLFAPPEFPEKSKWNLWKASRDPKEKTTKAINGLQEMEALGAEVMIVRASANDPSQVREALSTAIARFGAIHGLIHGTRTDDRASSRMILDMDNSFDARRLKALQSIVTLDECVKEQKLDFVLVFSPFASLVSGSGQCYAAAASEFLNAYACQKANQGENWLTIHMKRHFMKPEECDAILARILGGAPGPNLIVSPESFTPDLRVRPILSESAGADEQEQPPLTTPPQAISLEAVAAGSQNGVGHPTETAVVQSMSKQEANTKISLASESRFPAKTEIEATQTAETKKAAPAGPVVEGKSPSLPPGVILPPSHPRPNLSTAFVAPTNDTEKTIALIWQEILRVKEIGIKDNFFQLGGDSLLATQLMSRLRSTFQIELPLRYFFEYPTIEAMAKAVQTAKEKGTSAQRPSIARVPRVERGKVLATAATGHSTVKK